jgi:hypothetical protein
MRARCHDNNLNHTSLSDVCIKIGKEITNSGAVKRSEYEAHTKNFNDLDLKPLKKKYLSTKGEHKKLQKFLNSIEKKSLIEFFRIDVKRSRVIVELDENVTKIKGKRFCAEVILDDVAHIIDIPPSKKSSTHMPYIYNHDLEIEAEVLYEPCEYDTTPENAKYVTSPDMTPHEIEHCLNILKKELIKASSNKAYENTLSKCERGFIELGIIHGPQVQNAPPSHKKTRPPLIDLFKASAEGRLTPVKPNLLPKNLKPNILGYRSVAYKK